MSCTSLFQLDRSPFRLKNNNKNKPNIEMAIVMVATHKIKVCLLLRMFESVILNPLIKVCLLLRMFESVILKALIKVFLLLRMFESVVLNPLINVCIKISRSYHFATIEAYDPVISSLHDFLAMGCENYCRSFLI